MISAATCPLNLIVMLFDILQGLTNNAESAALPKSGLVAGLRLHIARSAFCSPAVTDKGGRETKKVPPKHTSSPQQEGTNCVWAEEAGFPPRP